jgi:hypothetical protein
MKNQFIILSAGMLAATAMVFAVSCDNKYPEPDLLVVQPWPWQDEVLFSADGNGITTGGLPISPTFTVKTNKSGWKISESDQSWLTITSKDNTFTLSAAPNGSFDRPADATITVTAGNAPVRTITVKQQGALPSLNLSSTEDVMIDAAGTAATAGTLTYTVTTNGPAWDVDPTPDWLIVTKSASGFTLSAKKSGFTGRSTTVTVKALEATVTLKVSQAASPSTDITAQVLKNTQTPFATDGAAVITQATNRYFPIKDWTTNEQGRINGNVFVHDNGNFDYVLGLSAWDVPAFPSASITNGKLYQTVELEAGTYKLTFFIHACAYGKTAYVVANLGNDLPDTGNVSSALAAVAIPDVWSNSSTSAEFTLTQKSTVSLGLVASIPGGGEMYFSKVELLSLQ